MPRTRHAAQDSSTAQSPVMVLLVLIATLGILLYAGFLLNPANRGDLLPYLMVIVAESILIIQALFSMWTILSGGRDPRDFAFHHAQSMLLRQRRPLAVRRPDRYRWCWTAGASSSTSSSPSYGEDLDKIQRHGRAAVAMKR